MDSDSDDDKKKKKKEDSDDDQNTKKKGKGAGKKKKSKEDVKDEAFEGKFNYFIFIYLFEIDPCETLTWLARCVLTIFLKWLRCSEIANIDRFSVSGLLN